jgi:plastocyanin
MKKVFGLCILVIIFLVAAGCTQPAPSTTATTTVPTAAATTETTTSVPTSALVENATAEATLEPTLAVEANVTSAVTEPSVTSVETTIEPTLSAVQTPVVKAKEIHIRNNTFIPPVTTVLPGTGITWFNDDTIIHSVKATGTHSGMFTSGDIAPGTQWEYTFGATEWTVTYTDPNFPGMNGSIIIQNGRTLTTSYGK